MKRAVAVALAALTCASPALADEDTQLWTQANAQGSLGGRAIAYAEFQTRFTDDVSRLGQLFVRPAVGVELAEDVQALLGYAYVRTDPADGSATDEHRVWQQLSWPVYKREGGWTVNARTRLEQRTVVGAGEVGWRARHQFRATHPLGRPGGVQALLFTEAFYAFNGADRVQREGFDQIRNFVGVSIPVGGKLSLEPGYLNQYIVRSGPNRVTHAANVVLSYRW